MSKTFHLILFSLCLIAAGCSSKKDSNTTPNVNPVNSSASHQNTNVASPNHEPAEHPIVSNTPSNSTSNTATNHADAITDVELAAKMNDIESTLDSGNIPDLDAFHGRWDQLVSHCYNYVYGTNHSPEFVQKCKRFLGIHYNRLSLL